MPASRRAVLAAPLAAAPAIIPVRAARASTLDAFNHVQSLRIRNAADFPGVYNPDFQGAYIIAPHGYLNWYFVNLGLLPFAARLGSGLQTYLERYIAHCPASANRKIQDYVFEGGPVGPRRSDSDDSYAATFLSLAIAYARTNSTAAAWFRGRLADIKDIADKNLVPSPQLNGLNPDLNHAQHTVMGGDHHEGHTPHVP